ncbi:hypothetical protein BLNAU_18202 [Blattamonas nauphoetae]|uniref:Uncharacterized protein n=1 Tax=Blattamonas nauphoetae TaxID=2049346 RepID=A0ABQ9X5M4_9EUKA|nr:hypothetical protein BLNAU_18202 [Blattamonas nauphoetae]
MRKNPVGGRIVVEGTAVKAKRTSISKIGAAPMQRAMPSRRRPVVHNTPPIVQPNPSDHKCPVDGSFAIDTRCQRDNHGTLSFTSSFRLQPGTPDPQRASSSSSLPQRCPPQIPMTIQFTNPHITLRPALSERSNERAAMESAATIERGWRERIQIVVASHVVMPESTKLTQTVFAVQMKSETFRKVRWFLSVSIPVPEGACPAGCSIQSSRK